MSKKLNSPLKKPCTIVSLKNITCQFFPQSWQLQMESVLEFGLTVAFSVQGVRIEPLPIDESYNKQIAVDIILNSSWELNQLLLMYG